MTRRIRPEVLLASICLLLGAIDGGPAMAATPGAISDFHISSCYEGVIGPAPHEGALVRQCGGPGEASVGILSPSGRLDRISTLEADGGPLLGGPDGEVWIATNSTDHYGKEPVGFTRIASDGSVQRFSITEQGDPDFETKPEVRGMVIDSEGALWAAVGYDGTTNPEWYGSIGGELVRITAAGAMTEFPTPTGVEPLGLALGAEGDLWFTSVRGMYSTEHTGSAGTSFVGRMTPGGEVELFRTRSVSGLGAIATAPDGTLWFGDGGDGRIGTIRPDGSFGRVYRSIQMSPTSLAFGPEGDLWAAGSGLVRVTPTGRRTDFGKAAQSVAVGPEGEIWAESYDEVWSVVPGAPGMELAKLTVEPGSKAAELRLACNGSTSACDGTLEISLPRTGKGSRQRSGARRPTFPVARTPYRVPAESSRTIRVKLPPEALAIAVSYGRRHPGTGPIAWVEATVSGGPTLREWSDFRVPKPKAQAGSAASPAK